MPPSKRRIEIFAHIDLGDDVTQQVSSTEAVIFDPVELNGLRGSIFLRNLSSSVNATIKTWVSNKKPCGTPLANPENWFIIDTRTLNANTKDLIRTSGAYRWLCITGVTSSGTANINIVPYFCMGAL